MPLEAYEVAMGGWYTQGMAGCEEQAAEGGMVDLQVYFPTEAGAHAAAEDFRRCGSTVEVVPVVNEDWNAQWRASMQPAIIAPGWWVSPLWLEPPRNAGDHWIKIEPKMAFGTGHHETTRLASRALIDLGAVVKGASFLDIGTGSGVLCFVAAMNGARVWLGVEIDPDCRENLAENRSLNNCTGCGAFVIGSTAALRASAFFDIIVMNMIHTESAPLLGDCRKLLAESGTLLWSGILRDEKQRAIDAAASEGFVLHGELSENEWWCGVFARHKA